MATAEELHAQIEAARRTGEVLDNESAQCRNALLAANERQRLRRELDQINEANLSKRCCIRAHQMACRNVDADRCGPFAPQGPVPDPESRVTPTRARDKKYYVKKQGDVASCRYNVFEKEHIWKIEGVSWLKRTLMQVGDDYVKSAPIYVGPQREEFVLNYSPFGHQTRFYNDEDDEDDYVTTCWQVGSLALHNLARDGTAFKYRFYIKRAGGEFVQWGNEGDACRSDYNEYNIRHGPDVQHRESDEYTPSGPIGIFGLSHDELLESDWIEDDTLTVKIQLQVRSCLPVDSLAYSGLAVDVPPPDLTANLKELLSDGKYSDVTVIVEGERIQVHSLILCMRSQVFDRLLNGGMRESIEKEVIIDDCDAVTFKAFLDFLYTDEFSGIETIMKDSAHACGPSDKSISFLQRVLAVSHRYQVSRLQLWCEQQLCDCLSAHDVCQVLCQAHLYDAKHLEEACLSYIAGNWAEVVANPAYGRLGVEWPELMLKMSMSSAGITEDRASAVKDAFVAAKRKPVSDGAGLGVVEGVGVMSTIPSEHEDEGLEHGPGHNASVDDARDGHDTSPAQGVSRTDQRNNENTESSGHVAWIQRCVLTDWCDNSLGDEYLRLQRDELLLVRPGLEDGWAFGQSIRQGISGWFPPAYVSQ